MTASEFVSGYMIMTGIQTCRHAHTHRQRGSLTASVPEQHAASSSLHVAILGSEAQHPPQDPGPLPAINKTTMPLRNSNISFAHFTVLIWTQKRLVTCVIQLQEIGQIMWRCEMQDFQAQAYVSRFAMEVCPGFWPSPADCTQKLQWLDWMTVCLPCMAVVSFVVSACMFWANLQRLARWLMQGCSLFCLFHVNHNP